MDAPETILAIEVSNPSAGGGAGVALGRIDSGSLAVVGEEPLRPAARHDDDLMPAIDRLARRAGIRAGDLGRIAVSVGPGGYTGLRIAVAAAKMIAEATGARTVAVPTALVVARRVSAGSPFLVALASKAGAAYITPFDGAGRVLAPGRIAGALDLRAMLGEFSARRLVGDRFVPEEFHAVLRETGAEVEPPRFDPVACLELGAVLSPVDPLALCPLYGREPEAVTQWRARHG